MRRVLSNKTVLGFVMVFFLIVNVGGLFATGIMMEGNAMNNCPFMGVPALCQMTPLGHASQWQQNFAAIVQDFAAAASVLLFVVVAFWYSFQNLLLKQSGIYIRRQRDVGRAPDPLQLAFARGILHSKAY